MKNIKFYTLLIAIITTLGLSAQEIGVTAGTKITVKSGTQLNLANGTDLVLEDSPATAPSFLQQGVVNYSTNSQAHVEQYLTKDTWNMVSAPVSDGIIEAYEWNYLLYYNEPDNSWNYLTQPTTLPLNPGQGYFVWPYTADPNGTYPASPDSAVIKGQLNHQDLNLTLVNTDASPKSGWNLLGNPFPIALNWNGDASWNLNNVGAAMYIKDPVSGNYVVWNYNTGGSNANGGYIAATQGFWVRTADTTGTPASMTLPASQRSHNDASFYKSGGPFLPEQLLVTVARENKTDKTILGFIQDATGGFDADYDATYLYGDEGALALYSMISETRYAMNHLPNRDDFPVIPLGFETDQSGEYTMSAAWLESFPEEVNIYLEDLKTGQIKDLRLQPEYGFVASSGDDVHRFNIRFTLKDIEELDGDALNSVNIYAWEQVIYVIFPEDTTGDIAVYDLMGKLIASRKNGSDKEAIRVNAGNVYLVVKVITANGVSSEKVFVR